jgi:malate synthase
MVPPIKGATLEVATAMLCQVVHHRTTVEQESSFRSLYVFRRLVTCHLALDVACISVKDAANAYFDIETSTL